MGQKTPGHGSQETAAQKADKVLWECEMTIKQKRAMRAQHRREAKKLRKRGFTKSLKPMVFNEFGAISGERMDWNMDWNMVSVTLENEIEKAFAVPSPNVTIRNWEM